MGFAAVQILSGATLLSELGIDISKNWLDYQIHNLGGATTGTDAANMLNVLAELVAYLRKDGGTMSGAIAMGTSKITGLGTPTADYDASTKKYVDDWVWVKGVTQSQPTRVLNVQYQNTSGKARLITISVELPSDAQGNPCAVIVYTGPTSGVDDTIGVLRYDPDTGPGETSGTITFIVPPDYYYELDEIIGSPSIFKWTEWDLG